MQTETGENEKGGKFFVRSFVRSSFTPEPYFVAESQKGHAGLFSGRKKDVRDVGR